MSDKILDRIVELENKAKERYIELCDWDKVMETLSKEELAEYNELQRKLKNL